MARSVSEFNRIYGSDSRVKWIKAKPCVFCGQGPCENAHVTNGGMGRKADADKIIPACRACHHEMDHGIGKKAMERKYGVNLRELARQIEAEWHLDF